MQTILLIDDDSSLLRVTEYNLSKAGFTVLAASSGKEGLALFHKKKPDVVVTDVRLGDMNGLDVLKTVKDAHPEVPIIIITAFNGI